MLVPPNRASMVRGSGGNGGIGGGGGIGRFLYILLLLALMPLGWRMYRNDDADRQTDARIERTLQAHPEAKAKLGESPKPTDYDNALALLPGKRIEGALLPRDTRVHWAFAPAAGAVFFVLVLLSFPRGSASVARLAGVGLFTATAGIALLAVVQIIARWTEGRYMIGGGVITILFWIAKFIGFSYRAALDPNSSFWLSYFGFTFGVGACEELCKALPLIVHYSNREGEHLPWRAACMIGLVSGVGFGVAEALVYCSDFYNGIMGIDAYVIRFVSCVVLHAVWSGAAGVFIYRQQELLRESQSIWVTAINAIALVSVSMILHGMYDTLLKKEYHMLALAVAIASIGWLVLQIELARRGYDAYDQARRPRVDPLATIA